MSEIPDDEFRAMWRDWLRNPSAARQVRVESEGTMKRYTLPELLSGAKNGTVTLDGEYVLYSDLIAAGCLVPVPVDIVPHQLPSYVLWNGKLWRVYKRHRSFPNQLILHGICNDAANSADEADCVPVRLVPLAGVGLNTENLWEGGE